MSSPLDSNFFNQLISCTSRKLELCTLRFAVFFKRENWFKFKSKPNTNPNSIQFNSIQLQEQEVKKSVGSPSV